MSAFLPPQGSNHYYYYYNAGPPPCNLRPPDNTHDALAQEEKLDIQKPESFTGRDPCKWRTYLTQYLNMFQAKPITFQLNNAHIAFAASYFQDITFNYYTVLFQFDPKFGVFDTVAEAENNFFNLQMCSEECFTTFIICFKKKPTRLGGTTTLSSMPFDTLFSNTSKTSSDWHPSNPPTMVTRSWSHSDVIKALDMTPEEPIDPDAPLDDLEIPEDKEALWAN
ncbi:hypothetical protein C0992_000752 [Termitomyces sp. T32_za158]|nr:hypothetical protein C0992_000752 [Termitomyces sp. T32_za158]